jgi:hypothetical protein
MQYCRLPTQKRHFSLAKPKEESALKAEFASGSRIIGIPEGADQIRWSMSVMGIYQQLSVSFDRRRLA